MNYPPRDAHHPEQSAAPLAQEKKRGWLTSVVGALAVVLLGSALASCSSPFGHSPSPSTTAPANSTASSCTASTVVTQLTDTAPAPTDAEFAQNQHTYANAPAMSIDLTKHYCVGLNTSKGLVVLDLDPSMAPNTVNNFVFLAQHHFYDGIKFHRVVPGFIVQSGDPQGNGMGGPGYQFNDEPVQGEYTQGCVAMANAGPNTNGSQFFICTADDSSTLQKQYNLFGHVVLGMNVVLKIQGPGDDSSSKNITPDVMNRVTVVAVKADSHTTATAATSTAIPTANPQANTCFLDPAGPAVPDVYAGNATPSSGPATAPKLKGTPVALPDGLQYIDIKSGSGPAVASGNQISANYTGWLASNCQKFDSSYDAHGGQSPQPFTTQIGKGVVIKGWDEGIIGMKAGGIRRLYIPAALAYGAQGAGPIPANADLIFDVQVVSLS